MEKYSNDYAHSQPVKDYTVTLGSVTYDVQDERLSRDLSGASSVVLMDDAPSPLSESPSNVPGRMHYGRAAWLSPLSGSELTCQLCFGLQLQPHNLVHDLKFQLWQRNSYSYNKSKS